MSRSPAALTAGVVLGLAAVFILARPETINWDCAFLLELAQSLLDGRMPYVDFIEPQPPLSMYLSALPWLVARALGTPIIPTFQLLVWALVAWSTFMVARLPRHAAAPGAWAGFAPVVVAWPLFNLLILVENHFGQREHLFFLTLLPYLVTRTLSWDDDRPPRGTAFAVGLLAGIGASLKPHFVAATLAPELYWVLSRRRWRALWRPEFGGLALAGTAYALHFLLLPEVMRGHFFQRWLPFVMENYAAYANPILLRMLYQGVGLAMATALLPAVFRPAGPLGAWRLAPPLAVATLVAAAGYVQQHRGWPYHAIPSWGGMTLLFGLAVLRVVARTPMTVTWDRRAGAASGDAGAGRAGTTRLFQAATVMLFGAYLWGLQRDGAAALQAVAGQTGKRATAALSPAEIIETYSREGDPILFLSTSIPDSYPLLLQMRRRPGSRYVYTFPLALLTNRVARTGAPLFRKPDELWPDEAVILRQLVQDVRRHRPRVIFIANTDKNFGCPYGFNVLEYLTTAGVMARIEVGYAPLDVPEVSALKFAVYLPKRDASA